MPRYPRPASTAARASATVRDASGDPQRGMPLSISTITEGGLPGYEFTTWYGVLAPRSTPSERVAALNGHIRNVLRTPEMKEPFLREGAEVIASTPEEFGKFLRLELAKWARVVKETGLKGE